MKNQQLSHPYQTVLSHESGGPSRIVRVNKTTSWRLFPLALGACIAVLASPALAAAQPNDTVNRAPGSSADDTHGSREDGKAKAAEPTPTVEPPHVIETPVAVYPEPAEEQRGRVEVKVELTVGVDGQPHDITVLNAPSPAFAQEAERIALGLKFTPARKNGQVVAARILYLCVFDPPQPTSPEVESRITAVEKAHEPQLNGTDSDTPGSSLPVVSRGVGKDEAEPVEVTIEGRLNSFDRMRQSAEQVTVIQLEDIKKRSTDMGEVLARTPGVVVRRTGGFGSETRLSLGGLYDDAVQVFIDGVPLALSGFPTNVSLVSVNIVRHVEIYHGIVPLRLSADALGGAINIATDISYDNHAAVSYQIGSFGMHRATGVAQARNDDTGFVSRVTGYFDSAKNNFEIDVEVPDDRGRLSAATVTRFHDRYRAYGYTAEVGYVERPWAERLMLKGFYGRFLKEYQHNITMTVPYGEVVYGERSAGLQLLYEQPLSDSLVLQAVAVVAHRSYDLYDESQWVYDWFGDQVRERSVAGEIESRPRNQTLWVNGAFGRGLLSWTPNPNHAIRLTTSPMYTTQTGDERRQLNPAARDPLTAVADMFRLVSGVGHEWHALPYSDSPNAKNSEDFALENLFAVKHYHYATNAEQPLPGDIFRRKDLDRTLWGVNEGIRYGITRWLFLKASYEYATRLPTPKEVFGDGGLVLPNVELLPETSHNLNLGLLVDAKQTAVGDFTASVTGIRRDTRDQIVMLGNDRSFTYQNVFNTVLHGAQAYFDWMSPARMFQFNAGGEYLDPRNDSDSGAFARYKGDRIPNRPNLMLSWGARLLLSELWQTDEVEFYYQGRFTDGFFRGWESLGLRESKQKVDPQTSHDAGVVYQWAMEFGRFTAGAEVQNVFDSKLFDNFGQQRPGRAYFGKLTAQFY